MRQRLGEFDPFRGGTDAADLAEEEVASAVHEELAYLMRARRRRTCGGGRLYAERRETSPEARAVASLARASHPNAVRGVRSTGHAEGRAGSEGIDAEHPALRSAFAEADHGIVELALPANSDSERRIRADARAIVGGAATEDAIGGAVFPRIEAVDAAFVQCVAQTDDAVVFGAMRAGAIAELRLAPKSTPACRVAASEHAKSGDILGCQRERIEAEHPALEMSVRRADHSVGNAARDALHPHTARRRRDLAGRLSADAGTPMPVASASKNGPPKPTTPVPPRLPNPWTPSSGPLGTRLSAKLFEGPTLKITRPEYSVGV
jgi:hypothetical protein